MPMSLEKQEEFFPNVFQAVEDFIQLHSEYASAYQLIDDSDSIIVSYSLEADHNIGIGCAIILHSPNNQEPGKIQIQPMAYKVYPELSCYFTVFPPETAWLRYTRILEKEELADAFRLVLLESANSVSLTNLSNANENFQKEDQGGYYERGDWWILRIPIEDSKDRKLFEGTLIL